jgi:hypothetical protein
LQVLICTHGHNLKPHIRQSLDYTFRNLFGFLRLYSAIQMIFASVENCSCNYRIHLMLIGHRSTFTIFGNKQFIARLEIKY